MPPKLRRPPASRTEPSPTAFSRDKPFPLDDQFGGDEWPATETIRRRHGADGILIDDRVMCPAQINFQGFF